MLSNFDNINNLTSSSETLDYEEYFGEMDITDEQKQERIEMAKQLEDEFVYILALIYSLQTLGSSIDWQDMEYRLTSAYNGVATLHMDVDDFLSDHIGYFSAEIIKSTREHLADPEYFNMLRAMEMAANESNSTLNYKDFVFAVLNGYTKKMWVSERDKYVRKTHKVTDSKVVDIKKPFTVGTSQLMFPKDTSLGAKLTEIVNCRCTLKYLK